MVWLMVWLMVRLMVQYKEQLTMLFMVLLFVRIDDGFHAVPDDGIGAEMVLRTKMRETSQVKLEPLIKSNLKRERRGRRLHRC